MIEAYKNIFPKIEEGVYIAKSASVIGDVRFGRDASVWYNTTIRGDVNYIEIGEESNVQDNSVIHVREQFPSIIGKQVTIGHNVTIHGAKIGDRCLIGIGSIILDGVEIGNECIIAAGAVLTPGTKVPDRTVMMGFPARTKRKVSDKECEFIIKHYTDYIDYKNTYLNYQ